MSAFRRPLLLVLAAVMSFALGLRGATYLDVLQLVLGVIAGACAMRAIELAWRVIEPELTNLTKPEKKLVKKVRETIESHQRQEELQRASEQGVGA